MKLTKSKLLITAIAALALQSLAPSFIPVAHAANAPQFAEMFVRMDRHKALAKSGALVCAKPSAESSTLTEASVTVTFPSITVPAPPGDGTTDFVVNATAANYTVTTTNLPKDPAPVASGNPANPATLPWPGIGTATSVTGHSVTFPSGDLQPGNLYCFNISDTNTVTVGSGPAGGEIAPTKVLGATLITQDASTATINQTNWATAVINFDTITYSAVVPPNFSLKLDANSDAFTANLDPAAIGTTGGRTVSISTNAANGWIAWTKDSQQGLFSAAANYKINSSGTIDGAPTTITPGTEGYGINSTIITDAPAGCTVVIDPEYYNASTTDTRVGHLAGNFNPLAQCNRTTTPDAQGLYAPGTSDGDVIGVKAYATIRGGTPAGSDYTDVVTIVGAGSF